MRILFALLFTACSGSQTQTIGTVASADVSCRSDAPHNPQPELARLITDDVERDRIDEWTVESLFDPGHRALPGETLGLIVQRGWPNASEQPYLFYLEREQGEPIAFHDPVGGTRYSHSPAGPNGEPGLFRPLPPDEPNRWGFSEPIHLVQVEVEWGEGYVELGPGAYGLVLASCARVFDRDVFGMPIHALVEQAIERMQLDMPADRRHGSDLFIRWLDDSRQLEIVRFAFWPEGHARDCSSGADGGSSACAHDGKIVASVARIEPPGALRSVTTHGPVETVVTVEGAEVRGPAPLRLPF